MHLRPIHVHIQLELCSDTLDVAKTFLVVGASATDPDLDFVLNEGGGYFAESADDTLEC